METSKIVEQILKVTNNSPYGRLGMDSSEASEIWKILNKELKQGQSLPIDGVSGTSLTLDESNDLACEFMANFGGLHINKVKEGVKADKIIQWVVDKIEYYR